jgi:hypothetical protein
MNSMQSTQMFSKRGERPIGVHIITAFDFLAVGLIPFIAAIWVGPDAEIGISVTNFVLAIGLALFTMAAAIWAWAGDNQGRLLLLALVTVTSTLIIANNINLIIENDLEGSSIIRLIGNIFRGLVWIGVNWWYFCRKTVIGFYKKAANEEMSQSAVKNSIGGGN